MDSSFTISYKQKYNIHVICYKSVGQVLNGMPAWVKLAVPNIQCLWYLRGCQGHALECLLIFTGINADVYLCQEDH